MPISPRKNLELDVRRVVEETLFVIGLTAQEVATSLGISRNTIEHDIKAYFSQKPDVVIAKGKSSQIAQDQAFGVALLKLIECEDICTRSKREYPFEQALLNALRIYVNVPKLKAVALGVSGVVEYKSSIRQDPPRYRNYRNLLGAVFGGVWAFDLPGEPDGGWWFLEYYLRYLWASHSLGERVELPNRKNFSMMLSAWAFGKETDDNLSRWTTIPLTQNAVRRIDTLITRLIPNEENILRLRFGLGWEYPPDCPEHKALTLEEIAKLQKITRERARQKEALALRALRQSEPFLKLYIFAKPEHKAVTELVEAFFTQPISSNLVEAMPRLN